MIKKIFGWIDHIIEKVGEWGLVLSGILILLMGFCSTYAVSRRYIFHNPESYSYEISIMFLTACVVLAVAGLQRSKRHLRVDFVSNYLPQKWQIVLMDILGPILALVFVGIIVWKSWDAAVYSMSIGERSQAMWEEPIYPIRFVIPVCMFWLCLVLIAQFVKGVKELAKNARVKALPGKPVATHNKLS
jgi:TRAP-type mannitol/chloroaromatic compound transport system permease small subunit